MGFNHIQNCITLDKDETIGLRDTDMKITLANAIMIQAGRGWCHGYQFRRN